MSYIRLDRVSSIEGSSKRLSPNSKSQHTIIVMTFKFHIFICVSWLYEYGGDVVS